MQRAIIVGASSGIGKALAELLVEKGFIVGITGRRINLLEEIRKGKEDKYFIKSFDVTDIENVEKNLNELTETMGGMDLLVLSSGCGDINTTLDFSIEKQTIDTNVTGFTAVVGWAYQYFENKKSGHLAIISSVSGLRGSRISTSYSASKAYQINYMEGMRQRAYNSGLPVKVTDIRPGFVATDMAKGDKVFWAASPDKAARDIYKAIKNGKQVVYITRRWALVAIIFKLIPGKLYSKLQSVKRKKHNHIQ